MKYMKRFLALALVAISILTFTLPAMAATHAGRGVVRTGGGALTVYEDKSTSSPSIGSLANSGVFLFRYNSPNDSWLEVYVNGTAGYVIASKVKLYVNMTGPNTQARAFGPNSESIQVHDKGSRVKNVQLILKLEKLTGGYVDGSFGSNTFKGVKEYQAKHGLSVDGIVGPATKRSMWSNHELYLRENGYK